MKTKYHVQHWELQYQSHLNSLKGRKVTTTKLFLIWKEKLSSGRKKKENHNT